MSLSRPGRPAPPSRNSSETDLAECCRRRSFSLSVNVNEGGRQRRLSGGQHSPTGGSVACQAFMAPADALGPDWFEEARRSLEQEVVLEGALHVPSVQVASCMQQYGDMKLDTAPSVKHQLHAALVDAALVDATVDEGNLIDKAVCLATPEVFDEEYEPHSAEAVHETTGKPAAAGINRAAQQASKSCPSSPIGLNCLRAQAAHGYSEQKRRRKRAVIKMAKAIRDSAKTLYSALQVAAPEQTRHSVSHGQESMLQQEVQPTQA